jgi:hypothetical protein
VFILIGIAGFILMLASDLNVIQSSTEDLDAGYWNACIHPESQ